MSMFNAFRSSGRVNQRGIFDFEDEFGRDPIRDRYANTSLAQEDSESRVRLAASEMELAKASLEASMRPAQVMSEFFTKMNSAVSQKADLEAKARGQAQAAQAMERLSKVNDFAGHTSILTEFPEATLDPKFKARWDAQGLSLQTKVLADFSSALNSAATADDIIRAQGSLPVEVLADPANRERIENLAQAAEMRVKAQRATQAASAITRATGTQETLNARMQYADVLSDPKVLAATDLASTRSAAIEGLTEAGADRSPITPTGDFDIDRAKRALAGTYTSQDVRSLQGTASNLTRQLAAYDDPEDPEAQKIQTQLDAINRQLGSAATQQERDALRAQAEAQSLGIGVNKNWQSSFIYGPEAKQDSPATPQPNNPAAPAPAPAEPKPAPEPEPISLEEEIKQTADADKRERALRSVQPKLEARKAERKSKIDKAERRLKRGNLIDERKRLNKAITDAGLGEETDVIKRAKARIAEINQELGE